MAALTVPTIFTAIDKFTAPLRGMEKALGGFAAKAEVASARADRAFSKLTPAISGAMKEFMSFASVAAISAAVVGGVAFSAKSIMEYEDALASFRTIVSDATDGEFQAFKTQITEVAKATNRSTIEVANSFQNIAGLNAEFAKTAEGLGAVSQAAITLSKASGDELGASADSLVGIMNQFGMAALEADRAINVLAAGQAVGAATITQTAESFKNFGSTANGANISLEQSVGLIQTLGKFMINGAEAGTKLRGAVSKLQEANVGYASGQFNINDALAEAKAQIDKLATAQEKDAAISKMFGLENKNAGQILLNNIDTYNKFTQAVTGTTEAEKAAAINSNTLSNRLDELSNAWVNMLTS
jgi:TP901 family phage tail tape measure protein